MPRRRKHVVVDLQAVREKFARRMEALRTELPTMDPEEQERIHFMLTTISCITDTEHEVPICRGDAEDVLAWLKAEGIL